VSDTLQVGFLTVDPAGSPPEPEPEASPRDYYGSRGRIDGYEVATPPERCETGTQEELAAKLYGCSGSLTTLQYQEASKFRDMPAMTWAEARIALNRLVVALSVYSYDRRAATTSALVALAEFALTARDFDFQGLKGDNAPRFRKELATAIINLRNPLATRLQASVDNAKITTKPISEYMRDRWLPNEALLHAMVPTSSDDYVKIIDATPDQAFASLEYLRRSLTDWEERRPFADDVIAGLHTGGVTAQDYAAAICTADALRFLSAKLVTLYAGIMHSIPLYRLYPATPEREAIFLWWPWGRPMPLVDGGPAKAPTPRKKVLDPGIIKATRPQDVVREVIERTGINRTTAQRMTADMRANMRQRRKALAVSMLRKGETRAAVARAVGLSASRISAMFKGQTFPTKARIE
jgi:hypothetical protein